MKHFLTRGVWNVILSQLLILFILYLNKNNIISVPISGLLYFSFVFYTIHIETNESPFPTTAIFVRFVQQLFILKNVPTLYILSLLHVYCYIFIEHFFK